MTDTTGTDGADRGLAARIVDMDEAGALAELRRRLDAGEPPQRLLDECRDGMELVGARYEAGRYFISALIMAGEIFREAAEILVPLVDRPASMARAGSIVMATVAGDIHDIGKNIAASMLDSAGVRVHDLGVDVPPARVVDAVVAHRPDVLGLSSLLSSGFGSLAETIAAVRVATTDWDRPLPIVIGGSLLDERMCAQVGADAWCRDIAAGVSIVRGLLAATSPAAEAAS